MWQGQSVKVLFIKKVKASDILIVGGVDSIFRNIPDIDVSLISNTDLVIAVSGEGRVDIAKLRYLIGL